MTDIDKNIVPGFLQNPRYKVYRHILLQLMILALTINISLDGESQLSRDTTAVLSWFCYYLLINGVIYFNLYVLTPRYLEKEKYQKYLMGVAGLILFTLLGITILQATLYSFKGIQELYYVYLIALNLTSSTFSIGLMIVGTSTLLLLRHWVTYSQRISELESTTLPVSYTHLTLPTKRIV